MKQLCCIYINCRKSIYRNFVYLEKKKIQKKKLQNCRLHWRQNAFCAMRSQSHTNDDISFNRDVVNLCLVLLLLLYDHRFHNYPSCMSHCTKTAVQFHETPRNIKHKPQNYCTKKGKCIVSNYQKSDSDVALCSNPRRQAPNMGAMDRLFCC